MYNCSIFLKNQSNLQKLNIPSTGGVLQNLDYSFLTPSVNINNPFLTLKTLWGGGGGGFPPPKKMGGHNFGHKLKNQSCYKWSEMARKLVENYFWTFKPPPKKNWGAYTFFLSKMKKIKVVKNCLKWRENWLKTIFGFFPPPPEKKENRVTKK